MSQLDKDTKKLEIHMTNLTKLIEEHPTKPNFFNTMNHTGYVTREKLKISLLGQFSVSLRGVKRTDKLMVCNHYSSQLVFIYLHNVRYHRNNITNNDYIKEKRNVTCFHKISPKL